MEWSGAELNGVEVKTRATVLSPLGRQYIYFESETQRETGGHTILPPCAHGHLFPYFHL